MIGVEFMNGWAVFGFLFCVHERLAGWLAGFVRIRKGNRICSCCFMALLGDGSVLGIVVLSFVICAFGWREGRQCRNTVSLALVFWICGCDGQGRENGCLDQRRQARHFNILICMLAFSSGRLDACLPACFAHPTDSSS